MDQQIQKITPDYHRIYTDLLLMKFPKKMEECSSVLKKKQLSAVDIIKLNQMIFGKQAIFNQSHRSYSKKDILEILNYQKKYRLNNSQVANEFKLCRNSVAKWRKMFEY